MSTKIYNGYKIKAKDLDEAMEIMSAAKSKIENLYDKYLIEDEVKKAITVLVSQLKHNNDLLSGLGLEEKTVNEIKEKYAQIIEENKSRSVEDVESIDLEGSVFRVAQNMCMQESEKIYRSKNNEFDIRVILYPPKFEIEGDTHYLFTLYAPRDLEEIFFEGIENVSEYGYWNNTDQLDTISDEDWEARGKNWDKAMPMSKPILDGMQAQFTDAVNAIYLISDSKKVAIRKELCKEEKIKNFYKHLLECEQFKLMYDILFNSSSKEDEDRIGTHINIKDKINNRKFNDKEAEIFKAIEKKIQTVFPQEITIDYLTSPIKESLTQIKAQLEKQQLSADLPLNIRAATKLKV